MEVNAKDKIATLSVMYEIIASMGKTMDWVEEVRQFLEKVSLFFGYEVASFLRFSIKKKRFYLEEVLGFPEAKELLGKEISSGYGVEEVMKKEPFIVQPLSPGNTHYIIHPLLRPRVRSLGFFPINRGNKFYGAVRLFSFKEEGFPHPYPSMIASLCNRFSLILSHIEAQNELLETKERLFHSQKMEALGILAGGIAHNFNNLLTAVIGYASFLKDAERKPVRIKALNNILSAGERGKTLVDSLLDFARKGKVERQSLSLQEVLKPALNIIKETIGKTIIIEEDFHINPRIKGDKNKLSSAFMSILLNSIEAMPGGGGVMCVRLDYKGLGENVVSISFKDTGVGMDRQTLERVFEPFFTTKEKGMGLGLTTAYGIIKDHGGEIEITSESGKGTEVKVYLPLEE